MPRESFSSIDSASRQASVSDATYEGTGHGREAMPISAGQQEHAQPDPRRGSQAVSDGGMHHNNSQSPRSTQRKASTGEALSPIDLEARKAQRERDLKGAKDHLFNLNETSNPRAYSPWK